MKNLKFAIVILIFSLGLGIACSQQSRTNTWDPTVEEVASSVGVFLNEANGSNDTATVQSVDNFIKSKDQNGVIYYAESGKTGTASSVASILDFSIFDGLPQSSLYDVATAKVLILDQYTETGRQFTLLLSIQLKDSNGELSQVQTAAFKTTKYTFDTNKAVIDFEKFQLTTFDISENIVDDFAGIVKFQVNDAEGVSFGQFSSMIGFGN